MLKKLLASILMLTMVGSMGVTLTGCSGKDKKDDKKKVDDKKEEKKEEKKETK